MSIYTRTGDDGKTSLFGGKRVLKCEELVDVYGSIDELNSWIGLVTSQIELNDSKEFLVAIQKDLFTIGSQLAGWPARNATQSVAGGKTDLTALGKRVSEMETRIDAMESEVGKLRNFILPGGSKIGAYTHLARSICRRVERQAVALFQGQTLIDKGLTLSENKQIIIYLNRLSDFLFMLARYINNQKNIVEVTWSGIDRPGKKK